MLINKVQKIAGKIFKRARPEKPIVTSIQNQQTIGTGAAQANYQQIACITMCIRAKSHTIKAGYPK